MVAGASALGYEYIASTDHSERAGASRTLSTRPRAPTRRDCATAQPGTVARHPERNRGGLMPDGRLDFTD